MKATNFVTGWKESAVEAAIILADEWCRQKTESIDLWSCDWFGKEFIETFLERCLQNRCLEDARQLNWHFPCETANWGEPLYEQTKKWTEDFMKSLD